MSLIKSSAIAACFMAAACSNGVDTMSKKVAVCSADPHNGAAFVLDKTTDTVMWRTTGVMTPTENGFEGKSVNPDNHEEPIKVDFKKRVCQIGNTENNSYQGYAIVPSVT